MDRHFFPLINRKWARLPLDLLMAALSSFDLWLPFLIFAGLLTLWLGGFKRGPLSSAPSWCSP